jgi:hypothetical protein
MNVFLRYRWVSTMQIANQKLATKIDYKSACAARAFAANGESGNKSASDSTHSTCDLKTCPN